MPMCCNVEYPGFVHYSWSRHKFVMETTLPANILIRLDNINVWQFVRSLVVEILIFCLDDLGSIPDGGAYFCFLKEKAL